MQPLFYFPCLKKMILKKITLSTFDRVIFFTYAQLFFNNGNYF